MIFVALVTILSTATGVVAERRRGAQAERAGAGVLAFMVWVLLPPITYVNVARLDISREVAIGVGFGGIALATALAVAYVVGSRFLGLPRATTGSLMLVAAFGNTGFLGLPVVAALFGGDDLGPAIVYDLVLTGIVLFTVGFAVGAAFGDLEGRRRDRLGVVVTRNPPLWAAALGLLAPAALAPGWAVSASHSLVYALPVLGFFAVGVTLSAEAEADRIPFPPPLDRTVVVALALKLGLVPAVLLTLGAIVSPVPGSFGVEAAMASAINCLTIAHLFALDRALVATVITWSTALVVAAGLVASLV